MKKISLTGIMLLVVCLSIKAVPPHPQLLQNLLEQGDTVRYEQMLRQGAIVNRRRPARPLMAQARAAQGPHRQFGVTPLMASRGLLILANFKDLSFQASNSRADLDSMMNALNYTYQGATGSAAQYFADQSNGAYRPHFDVVGPITLPQNTAYYGRNVGGTAGEDQKIGDFVLHCCSIAAALPGVNLADYDADGNGELDFVYIIYAGKGEADGGASNTLWPASWDMESAIQSGSSSLPKNASPSQYTFDGVKIGNFAYSGEQDGQTGKRNGIGTPTHEFSHVLGLPDFYDVYYGDNSSSGKTPGDWDVMDSGPYNNNGKTPPSYSAWEKAFMGWIDPVNPGNEGQSLTLYPSGSEEYQAYQLNASGTLQAYNDEGVCYYIENRQQAGWDAYLPGHGLLIWKVDYNQDIWEANEPNASYDRDYSVANRTGAIHYTVVSATGKTTSIGSSSDPFPGAGRKTSWNGLSGKPLLNIAESNNLITLTYIEEPAPTALESVNAAAPASKIWHNGNLYVRLGEQVYTVWGSRITQ